MSERVKVLIEQAKANLDTWGTAIDRGVAIPILGAISALATELDTVWGSIARLENQPDPWKAAHATIDHADAARGLAVAAAELLKKTGNAGPDDALCPRANVAWLKEALEAFKTLK